MTIQPGDLLRALGHPYDHYGVAVHNNEVVHLTGQVKTKADASVQKTSFDFFCAGRQAQILPVNTTLTPDQIVARAEFSVGKKPKHGYSITERNCEHFARCVVTGRADSTQVRKFIEGVLGLGVLIFIAAAVEKDGKSSCCATAPRKYKKGLARVRWHTFPV
ncbi:MAG: lecithin retinol acyltransferase family protein [Planctomycetota bacterium]